MSGTDLATARGASAEPAAPPADATRRAAPVDAPRPVTPDPAGLDEAPTTSPDVALHRFLRAGQRRAVDRHDAELWAALARAADGGKRLRPALVMSAHEAFGGTDPEAAAQVAAAMELLHTAFVVHDDLIDGDDVRRGRPNVAGTFTRQARRAGATPDRAERYGAAAAVLAGDLALAGAVRTVALCGAPPAVVRRLLDLVDHAVRVSAAGELADVRHGLGPDPASLAEALTTAERKTSVYSFALPLQAGAVLAHAPDAAVAALGELGRLLGVAFQLRDDLDGVFGTPAETGKSVLSDLREGKCTPLVAHASTTGVWPELRPYLGDERIDDAGAARVRELLTACGARAFVENLAAGHCRAARRLADELGLAPGLRAHVHALTDSLTRRAA
ncbi:polyprenyl synthetase family protein [Georgenia sp. TF02-10]|uniref:polyprenyl synthetase family protein n=1 Tax=Georgenia sp. TF02-10 TaxID=2917725 RepID=UPI001FA76936|nr:polyprenyl synthetase family protein [Georgenia sp. TF02-10]UNX54840.1 polyprenyl synthetase family protein [Georgenia sp. TF02-10]